MKISWTICFLWIWIISGSAQTEDYLIPGEMLIQFSSTEDFQKFSTQHIEEISFDKQVSSYLNLYLYRYNPEEVSGENLTEVLNENHFVKAAGQNFRTAYRTTIPNDVLFDDQNYLDVIQAPEAWDIVTTAPEEVVIAIIEGADIEHEDLKDNIWTNPGEIPDDGIDNDNNGYIDDYYGVNVVDSTDTPIDLQHPTSVTGIAGARGDNDIGISGILWDVNLMIVSHDLTFVKIVEAYEYVYEMRKRYNETNGAEGAFVVVTNGSFGRNNAFPSQLPIYQAWCEAYDMLGSVGVLSASATNNTTLNIDDGGDMPGLCQSEYLIMVTNIDEQENLRGGFSFSNIDIAAPGNGSFSTYPNDQYGDFNGTSAATPMVAGAIGMLYSYPCDGLLNEAIINPSGIAQMMKDILLENVEILPELEGKIVSQGRLNLLKIMEGIQSALGAPIGKLGFLNLYPNPVRETLYVEYRTSEQTEYDIKVYDAMGRLVYIHQVPAVCAPRVIEIPVQNMGQGMHFISIENINNIESSRFWVY